MYLVRPSHSPSSSLVALRMRACRPGRIPWRLEAPPVQAYRHCCTCHPPNRSHRRSLISRWARAHAFLMMAAMLKAGPAAFARVSFSLFPVVRVVCPVASSVVCAGLGLGTGISLVAHTACSMYVRSAHHSVTASHFPSHAVSIRSTRARTLLNAVFFFS